MVDCRTSIAGGPNGTSAGSDQGASGADAARPTGKGQSMSIIGATADPTPPDAAPARSYRELAIWSVICGIWVLGPIGILMSLIALKSMLTSRNLDGRNIALAGDIVGAIATVRDAITFNMLAKSQMTFTQWSGSAIMACLPLYLIVQIWFGYAWRGRWRIAALVPAMIAVPVLALTVAGAVNGSNLFPLPLISFAPFGLAHLLLARVVRAIIDRRAAV
jgi:hypothetical protein